MRRKVQTTILAIRTLRRMFSFIEFPRALSRSEALGRRMHIPKDGAYYCYCAYVLHISRYLGFPMGGAF